MGSPELAKYADFYADMTDRFALTDNLSLWRDISERLHQLTSEPEDVTYRDVTFVNADAVKFLGRREADGTRLENCPLHVRKWIDELKD